MSDEPFERFLAQARKRFWKLPPVRMEVLGGPSGEPICLPNSIYDAAYSLVSELPYTQVVQLLHDAHAHNDELGLMVADDFAAEAATYPHPTSVCMAVAACAANAQRRLDERLKTEDRLRSELAEGQSPSVSRR